MCAQDGARVGIHVDFHTGVLCSGLSRVMSGVCVELCV